MADKRNYKQEVINEFLGLREAVRGSTEGFLEALPAGGLAVNLLRIWTTLHRRSPIVTSVATVIAVVSITMGIAASEAKRTKLEKQKKESNADYAKQLARLDETGSNLKDLLEFVEMQKEQLQQTEDTLKQMKEEQGKIDPILQSKREAINSLFAIQEQRNAESLVHERLVGFWSGVVSSIVASGVLSAVGFALRKYYIKKMETAKTEMPPLPQSPDQPN